MPLAEALIAGVNVRCKVVERDRHGRIVAKVFSPNGVLAYRRYSMDHVHAEDEARKARREMWRASNRRKLIRPDIFTLALARAGRYALLLQHPFPPDAAPGDGAHGGLRGRTGDRPDER